MSQWVWGCSSAHQGLAPYAGSCVFDAQHCISQLWWCKPAVPTSGAGCMRTRSSRSSLALQWVGSQTHSILVNYIREKTTHTPIYRGEIKEIKTKKRTGFDQLEQETQTQFIESKNEWKHTQTDMPNKESHWHHAASNGAPAQEGGSVTRDS